jgi:hypothetical protein
MIIRHATKDDAQQIFQLGHHDDAFRVSDQVPFYEFDEIVAWIEHPEDNIFLVAIQANVLVGFLFCKVMSIHWAMLDNFYVEPANRGSLASLQLFEELKTILRVRGTKYLSMLVKSGDARTSEVAAHVGFSRQDNYTWLDMFIS